VPPEGKFLLIAFIIVRITFNVIVHQINAPLEMSAKQWCVHRSKTCCQTLKHFDNVISTCCENVVEVFESLTTSF